MVCWGWLALAHTSSQGPIAIFQEFCKPVCKKVCKLIIEINCIENKGNKYANSSLPNYCLCSWDFQVYYICIIVCYVFVYLARCSSVTSCWLLEIAMIEVFIPFIPQKFTDTTNRHSLCFLFSTFKKIMEKMLKMQIKSKSVSCLKSLHCK